MHRTKKNPNISSADNIQHFRQSFLAALNKLNDTATKQLGLDDIHNILSQQAQGPEYISLVLHLLSENDEHQKVGARRETLKVLGIMAEVFENKILEFFPKILSLVTKKLKENNPQIHDSLSDATGSVIGFGLRRLPTEEACKHINSALRTFYSLSESSNKYTQMGSSMCIYKIIQCSPVECLYLLTDELSERLADLLHNPGCKAHLQIFECILSLILGVEDNTSKLKSCSRILLPVVMDNLANLDWNVRKIAVDVVYTISVLLKGAIAPRKQELLTALNHCKFDKIKNVRDITATTINFLKSIPDPPSSDVEETAISPVIPTRGEERSKTKEGVVYVSFGKSDPTLKTMLEKPQRPGGDLGLDESSQQKGGKSKNNREINPNFFNNAPKGKGDVEIFSKGTTSSKHQNWIEPPKQESAKHQSDLSRGLESTKGQIGSSKRTEKNPPIVEKHPVVTDFLEDSTGLRPASAQKKSRPEDTIQSHRRQASEQSDYVLSAKLSQTKSDLIPPRKKEFLETNKNAAPLGTIETPAREGLSGSRLQNPDSASLSSPHALFADDFANLSRQLKKINKQQTQLIESVSSFQNTTQSEIASLKNRMGALEDFVQKIYQTQKESSSLGYHYAPSPTQYPSSPGYGYPMQPYNGVYSHQYPPGAFRDAYLQSPAQSADLHDQLLRQSYPASSYPPHESYNRYMPQQGTYQNLNSGLAESASAKQRNQELKPKDLDFDKQRKETTAPSEHKEKYQPNSEPLGKDPWSTKTRKSSTWVKVEELLKKGHVGEAYAVCVGQGDEDSVIKLMRETGVVVHLLSELVVEEVIGMIDKRIFESKDRGLILDWIEKSLETKSLTSTDLLMKLHEILAQVLGDSSLATGEYQRVGKMKSDVGALLSRDENSDTEERHKKGYRKV